MHEYAKNKERLNILNFVRRHIGVLHESECCETQENGIMTLRKGIYSGGRKIENTIIHNEY